MKTFLQYLTENVKYGRITIGKINPMPPFIPAITNKFHFNHLNLLVSTTQEWFGDNDYSDYIIHAHYDEFQHPEDGGTAAEKFANDVNSLVHGRFNSIYHLYLQSDESKSNGGYWSMTVEPLGCFFDTAQDYEQALTALKHVDDAIDKVLQKSKCPDCHGSGKYVGLNSVEPCKNCGGSGKA